MKLQIGLVVIIIATSVADGLTVKGKYGLKNISCDTRDCKPLTCVEVEPRCKNECGIVAKSKCVNSVPKNCKGCTGICVKVSSNKAYDCVDPEKVVVDCKEKPSTQPTSESNVTNCTLSSENTEGGKVHPTNCSKNESIDVHPTSVKKSCKVDPTPVNESCKIDPTPVNESCKVDSKVDPTPESRKVCPTPVKSCKVDPTPVNESCKVDPTPVNESCKVDSKESRKVCPTPVKSCKVDPTPLNESSKGTPVKESSKVCPTPVKESSKVDSTQVNKVHPIPVKADKTKPVESKFTDKPTSTAKENHKKEHRKKT